MNTENIRKFRQVVWRFYKLHGRHDLPWRLTADPYCILVSEIMLQQTQVSRVVPKYMEFLNRFPDFSTLAAAPLREVVSAWQGLGYNRRALYLKRAAELVKREHGGVLPQDATVLVRLPGIGPNTAAAIGAYAFHRPVTFIETNIRRVFIHHFFGDKKKISDADLVPFITRALGRQSPREWYWALMDYGSYLATQIENPNRRSLHYAKQSAFKGSQRQLRGKVLAYMSKKKRATFAELAAGLDRPESVVKVVVATLAAEGFLRISGVRVRVA